MQAQVQNPYHKGPPDATGLAAAQAAQDAARPAVVILFDSRARRDWREHSDIDLLVITGEEDTRAAQGGAHWGVQVWEEQRHSGLQVDIIPMTRRQFERCRRAKQHIAGQADTYGVVMSGEELEYRSGYEDEYPDHWPATINSIENEMLDASHWDQAIMGMSAQRAVENALEGVLSCLNAATGYSHNLLDTWKDLQSLAQFRQQAPEELLAAGQSLFEYLKYPDPKGPGEYLDWLTEYAAHYRYFRSSYTISQTDRLELQSLVNSLVEALVEHTYRLSGATPQDVYPDGLRPWERHQSEV